MATAIQPPCDESIGTDSRPAECASPKGTLVATVLGSSLAFVIGSIVNVALPQMQRTLATDAAGAQWIINAYLLPLSALVLLGGALGDHYGRRRIFLWGIAVMAAATLACAFAPTLELVLAARAVEGVGAALLAPTSLAIIAHAFKGKERGRAIGIWAGAGAVAGAAAPLIGGWLVDTLSWRWAFGVIVPPAAATWWIALRHVSESREEDDPAPLDWLGAGLTILALGGLVFALITFAEVGAATPQVLASAAVGTVAAAAFFIVEHRKGERAMMPLAIFGTPSFAGISLLTLLLYAALGGLLVLLPYTLIAEEGYSATAARRGNPALSAADGPAVLARRRAGGCGRREAAADWRPACRCGGAGADGLQLCRAARLLDGGAAGPAAAGAGDGVQRRAANDRGGEQRRRRAVRRSVGRQQRHRACGGPDRDGAARLRAGRRGRRDARRRFRGRRPGRRRPRPRSAAAILFLVREEVVAGGS